MTSKLIDLHKSRIFNEKLVPENQIIMKNKESYATENISFEGYDIEDYMMVKSMAK